LASRFNSLHTVSKKKENRTVQVNFGCAFQTRRDMFALPCGDYSDSPFGHQPEMKRLNKAVSFCRTVVRFPSGSNNYRHCVYYVRINVYTTTYTVHAHNTADTVSKALPRIGKSSPRPGAGEHNLGFLVVKTWSSVNRRLRRRSLTKDNIICHGRRSVKHTSSALVVVYIAGLLCPVASDKRINRPVRYFNRLSRACAFFEFESNVFIAMTLWEKNNYYCSPSTKRATKWRVVVAPKPDTRLVGRRNFSKVLPSRNSIARRGVSSGRDGKEKKKKRRHPTDIGPDQRRLREFYDWHSFVGDGNYIMHGVLWELIGNSNKKIKKERKKKTSHFYY